MKSEKLSIVIPLYNKAGTIRRAIDSVLAQTVQNWSLYVINDGSTDEGPSYVDAYEDERIHLISQENAGVSAARNHGIELAGSGLVAFLDADDFWDPGMLEELLLLRQLFPRAGMYATGFRKINENGSGISISVATSKDQPRVQIADYLRRSCTANFVHTSSVALPYDVLKETGAFPVGEKFGEDTALWGRVSLMYDLGVSSRVCGNFVCDSLDIAPRHREGMVRSPLIDVLDRAFSGEIYNKRPHSYIQKRIRSQLCQGFSYHVRRKRWNDLDRWMANTRAKRFLKTKGWLLSMPFGKSCLVFCDLVRRGCTPAHLARLIGRISLGGLTFERVVGTQSVISENPTGEILSSMNSHEGR